MPLTSKLIDRLIQWRWPLLIAGVLLAVAAYLPARQVQFDQSIENMFAPGDPLLVPFAQLNRTFGGNEIVLAAYVDPRVLTSDGMGRLKELTQQIAAVPGVAAAQSLSSTPLGASIASSPKLLELFEGYTIGADRQTVAVVCILHPKHQTNVPRGTTVDALRAIIETQPNGMLAGEPVMIVDGFRYLEADGRILMGTSTVLLMLTIVLCFRSLRWVLIPIAVVQLTLWLTQAILVWFDLKLSMVSSMLSAIVTIVGVATVMHLTIAFREQRALGRTPIDALLAAGIALAMPIFSACLTDTVGCGSLLLARVGPVQDFGAMTAIGLSLVLLSIMLLVPGLVLLGRFDADPKRSWGEDRLDVGLYRSIDTIERHPWPWGIAAIAITVLAVLGSMRLEIESDFTRNFRAGSPLVRSYEFVEENLGGAGVWDMMVPAPANLDIAFLSRVAKLEVRLRNEVQVTNADGQQEPGLTKVFSLADVVLAAAQTAFPFQIESLERMPSLVAGPALSLMKTWMPDTIGAMYGEDPQQPGQHYFRIMLRSKERQAADQKKLLIATVERIGQEEFPPGDRNPPATPSTGKAIGTQDAKSVEARPSPPVAHPSPLIPSVQVTGFFVLLTNLIDSLLRDQWVTFMAATAGMWLIMLVIFRSPTLATIGLVPNILPVFVMTGAMGWLGLRLNMGAAVIAAFSMGLSVDSSVHYIVDFQRARRRGLTLRESLDAAQQSAGRAAVFATLALVVGFSALCFSEFVPTIYFGALTGLTMLGGLMGNLLLLPLLLRLVTRKEGLPRRHGDAEH